MPKKTIKRRSEGYNKRELERERGFAICMIAFGTLFLLLVVTSNSQINHLEKQNIQLAKPLADDYCKLQTYPVFTGIGIEIKECWECNSCIPMYVQQLIDSQINMSRKMWEIKRIDNKECLIYPTQIIENINYSSAIIFTNQMFNCVGIEKQGFMTSDDKLGKIILVGEHRDCIWRNKNLDFNVYKCYEQISSPFSFEVLLK